jgi:hypothetical protein
MRAAVQHVKDLGFKVAMIDGGQVALKCTCYSATPRGAQRVKFVAQSMGEAVVWATQHNHEHDTLEGAAAECRRMAAERRRATR